MRHCFRMWFLSFTCILILTAVSFRAHYIIFQIYCLKIQRPGERRFISAGPSKFCFFLQSLKYERGSNAVPLICWMGKPFLLESLPVPSCLPGIPGMLSVQGTGQHGYVPRSSFEPSKGRLLLRRTAVATMREAVPLWNCYASHFLLIGWFG